MEVFFPEGRVLQKMLGGVCGPLPKTLTLYMIIKFDIICMAVAADTVALNIIYEGLLLMVLLIIKSSFI